MKYIHIPLSLILLQSLSFSYTDMDIDGIEDSIDLCLNTPFDALVDRYGCQLKNGHSSHKGKLTLKLSATTRKDDIYDDENSIDFYSNYRYKNFDISFSNNNYINDAINDNNIYISAGYTTILKKSFFKLSLGTALNDNRDNDYTASINYDYFLNSKQDLFIYYGYTLSGESENLDYDNYSSFSIGTSYIVNKSYYLATSYNYTQSAFSSTDDQQSISIFNSYNINKNLFLTFSYTYGIDDLSYDHTLSIGFGLNIFN